MSADVVDLILNDHRELERLFHVLLNEPEERPTLTPVMTALLAAHSRAEESEVYPVARDAGDQKDVEHSQKEHLEADQLAMKLVDTEPSSDEFVQRLTELIKSVRHHLEEEEETVLPDIREHIDESRRIELGQAFLSARAQLLGRQPGDLTKAQLEQQAENIGLDGASSMDKDALRDILGRQAER